MKKFTYLLPLLGCLCAALPLTAHDFPLCLYGVNDPKDLKLIKKSGFSCVQAYNQDPQHLEQLAREAAKRGLQVVFYPNKVLGSEYEAKAQSWPVLAWYLVDEPDVARWSRSQVQAAHARAKQAFPRHRTALVIGQGKTKIPYYDLPDVMMMDWYPVPHLALTSFGDNVRYVKEGMAKSNRQDYPMWGVVQSFDWKNYKQYRPDNDRIGRFPTIREIRFMSYDGILNGTTGLFYYTFNHQGKPLPYAAPAYWARVKTVVKELSRFKHVLEQGTAVSNPVSVRKPLRMQSWSYKGHTYSILLNASQEPQEVPAELLTRSYRLLYGSKKTSQIPEYEVWILKH
ncbi:MAG: hypothetical protein IJ876_04615 [Elusimicrobiaceae bacterium]|nr:hypothetical protein [Elusimicrobiaceae bacterium]